MTLPEATVNKLREKAASREATVQRKRESERKWKDAKKKERDATPHAFWEKNRAAANQTRIRELLERQDYVFALHNDMRTVIENRPPAGSTIEEWTSDVKQEIEDDRREHGFTTTEITALPFWTSGEKEKELYATLSQRPNATAIFVRYGIVTAVAGYLLHEFDNFLKGLRDE